MTSASPDLSEWHFPNRSTPLGSPVYYAVRFSPAAQRERDALLVAWFDLIQQIADRPHDPGVARLKLDWWREQTAGLGSGRVQHPLAAALWSNGVGSAAVVPMRGIIDAAENLILAPTPHDDAAFLTACRRTLGPFFVLLAGLEPRAGHDDLQCIEAGGYCAAVARVRERAVRPDRVPADLSAQAVDRLDPERRRARLEGLLADFPDAVHPSSAKIPGLARRLTALAAAQHNKMRHKGYPGGPIPIDRAPIAHLWTAWRCR